MPHSPSLFRCVAAMVYDGFIVFSLLLLATAIALFFNGGESLLPHRGVFLAYLFTFCGFFFSYCWHKSGQTLGMLAWKIKVTEKNGKQLSFAKAWLRFLFAFLSLSFFGIGFFWRFFDSEFLHDRLLGNHLKSA